MSAILPASAAEAAADHTPLLDPRNAWISLAILTGLNLVNYMDRMVVTAVAMPLKLEFHLNDEEWGRVGTAFMIGYFVTSPFFGYLGDRMSRKKLLIIGILIWSIGTILSGFAVGLMSLLAYRVLVGFGEASYATLSPSWISDLFPARLRNNCLTYFYVAMPIGAAIGSIAGSAIAASNPDGWRHAFYISGMPGLLLIFTLFWMREPKRGESDGHGQEEAPKPETKELGEPFRTATTTAVVAGGFSGVVATVIATYGSFFRNANYMRIAWGNTAYIFALGAYTYWGQIFLEQAHGMKTEEAGTFIGAVAVFGGLFGTLLGGTLATKWKRRNAGAYPIVSAISVFLVIPFSIAAFQLESRLGTMICMGIALFFIFVPTGPSNTMLLESAPPAMRASAMALGMFVSHLFGDLWSPWLVGYFSTSWGNLAHALMILPGAFLVAAVLWGWQGWAATHAAAKASDPVLAS